MLQEIFPSLFWLRSPQRAPATPFTYVLRRPTGNILLGTKENLSSFADTLQSLGGINSILLGDRHHALPHSAAFARECGAVLTASDIEAKALRQAGVVVGRTLPHARAPFADDLEIIPTPGHTRGALSYLWTNGRKRYLFIGDTLVPQAGIWEFYVTRANRSAMARTVRLLATVKFDVILSNSFAAAQLAWLEVTAQSRAGLFAEVLDRLTS